MSKASTTVYTIGRGLEARIIGWEVQLKAPRFYVLQRISDEDPTIWVNQRFPVEQVYESWEACRDKYVTTVLNTLMKCRSITEKIEKLAFDVSRMDHPRGGSASPYRIQRTLFRNVQVEAMEVSTEIEDEMQADIDRVIKEEAQAFLPSGSGAARAQKVLGRR